MTSLCNDTQDVNVTSSGYRTDYETGDGDNTLRTTYYHPPISTDSWTQVSE